MPTPGVSHRLKRLRRRFGISAPRVVVRSVLPVQWLLAILLAVACLVFALIWLVRDGGLGDSVQLQEVRERLHQQQAELVALRSVVGTGQSVASMERATQQQLLSRMQELEAENAALKEDILIFERLIPVTGQDSVARIENFRVSREALSRYRYRLLLAFQSAQRGAVFRGEYRVVAEYRLGGGAVQRELFPERSAEDVEIRHFFRREGVIDLPENAELISVEARLLQGGKLLASRTANL